MALEDFEQEDNDNDDIEEKGYDRYSLFNKKPRSNLFRILKTNNLLVPKSVRKTHDRFHVFYSPMGKDRGCDFTYHTYGRNKDTGIYEHLLSQVIAHEPKKSWWGKARQKGDGVIYNLLSYDEPHAVLRLAFKLSQFFSFNLYKVEYSEVEYAPYMLNKDNGDYLYELALKLPDDKSMFDYMSLSINEKLIENSKIISLERKKNKLNYYSLSPDAKKHLLKDKENVLYFCDTSEYYLNDIYKNIHPVLLDDADVALKLMILGAKEFKLSQKLRTDKEFALHVAQNAHVFGMGKSNKGNKGNKNKSQSDDYRKKITKADFFAFFPDAQSHEEIALALKNTLGEYIPGKSELDKLYGKIMPYEYSDNYNDNHDMRTHLPVVNWKDDYVECIYEIFIWNADKQHYIKEHSGKLPSSQSKAGSQYANYLDNRFRDLEAKCAEAFLNMHDRDYLIEIIKDKVGHDDSDNEINGLTLRDLLDMHHPNFSQLMADKDFILQSRIPVGTYDVRYLSESLQKDKDIALHAIGSISQNYSYHHVSLDDFRDLNADWEVVEAFCKSSGSNFKHVNNEIRKDKALTLELIKKTSPQTLNLNQDGKPIIYSNSWEIKHYLGIYDECEFKDDKDVVLMAVKHFHCLDNIEDKLKNDWDIQSQAVLVDPNNYHYTSEDFREHPDNLALGLQVFEYCAKAYELLPKQTRENRDIAQDALKRHVSLMHLPEHLQDDEKMALFALTVSSSNYQYFSERLKDREDMLLLVTTGYRVLSLDRHTPYSNIYMSLIEELEDLQESKGYEYFNLNIYGKTDLIEYASERLRQKFGTTQPYEYLKGEYRAQSLADKLERYYGNNDNDAQELLKEIHNESEYCRPYKI